MEFVVKEFEISNRNQTIVKVIGIGIKESNGNVFPSPITNFIKSEFRNKGNSINSQRNAAYAITRFLNYINKQINHQEFAELINKGLKGLTLEIGANYITSLSLKNREGNLSSDYVNGEINYINKFYYWLKKQKIISQSFIIDYENNTFGRRSKKIEKNLFELNDIEIIFPTKNSLKQSKVRDFGTKRSEMVLLFINTAKKIEPHLALGVALQFFGGLRRSEVVNLKKSSLYWINNNLIAEIRDNQSELFTNLKNTTDSQVKNPRDQSFICNEILKILFTEHNKMLEKLSAPKNESLFISPLTKKAISGKNYSEKFTKIKAEFLATLLHNENINEYLLLTQNKWSTHIGRGVFTNLLLDLGLTETQLALARGDKNINAALSYLDEKTMLETMNMAINNFRIIANDQGMDLLNE